MYTRQWAEAHREKKLRIDRLMEQRAAAWTSAACGGTIVAYFRGIP
jgi:hypothetical protein